MLDKYIDYHKLRKPRLVADKCSLVIEHFRNSINKENPDGGTPCHPIRGGEPSESESESSHSSSENFEADVIIASCCSSDESSSTNDGDQARERPPEGFFSLREGQTRRGRTLRPPAHFSDFY